MLFSYCLKINSFYLNKIITIFGWIYNIKFHGFYIFFNIKDKTGFFQVVLEKRKTFLFSKFLKNGDCVKIIGIVCFRKDLNFNLFSNNGFLELFLLRILFINYILDSNKFFLSKQSKFLNLKSFFLNILSIKSFFINLLLFFFYYEGFLYIETPVFSRFLSEGSRVFLIPFRLKNIFFSLSQSPQIFKQIFMISGFDKYYQISKCFRDEDFRKDRNSEFIQLDCEISFFKSIDIYLFFDFIFYFFIFKLFNINKFFKFSSIFYKNCLNYFITDKPDLRFKFIIFNIFINLNFYYFFFKISFIFIFFFLNLFFLFGNNFKNYYFFLKNYIYNKTFFLIISINFFYFFIFSKNFFLKVFLFEIISFYNLNFYFLVFFNFFKFLEQTFFFKFAFINNFLNFNFFFLWILNFKIFSYNKKRYTFNSNPFSKILSKDIYFLDTNPLNCVSKSYDIVLNGIEIGGGSVRNDKFYLQKKNFFISLNFFETSYNFNFFLNSFKFSAPIHCGLALGLDRILFNFLGINNIKLLSFFHKSKSFGCFFSKSPNFIFK